MNDRLTRFWPQQRVFVRLRNKFLTATCKFYDRKRQQFSNCESESRQMNAMTRLLRVHKLGCSLQTVVSALNDVQLRSDQNPMIRLTFATKAVRVWCLWEDNAIEWRALHTRCFHAKQYSVYLCSLQSRLWQERVSDYVFFNVRLLASVIQSYILHTWVWESCIHLWLLSHSATTNNLFQTKMNASTGSKRSRYVTTVGVFRNYRAGLA